MAAYRIRRGPKRRSLRNGLRARLEPTRRKLRKPGGAYPFSLPRPTHDLAFNCLRVHKRKEPAILTTPVSGNKGHLRNRRFHTLKHAHLRLDRKSTRLNSSHVA